jgi:predicted anti-sigma-YlaC factor YlaD
MDCSAVRRHCGRFLADRMGAAARRRFEKHIDECLSCRHAVRARRALAEAVRGVSLPAKALPDGLRDAIQGCMNCMDDPGRTVCPRLRRRLNLVPFPPAAVT